MFCDVRARTSCSSVVYRNFCFLSGSLSIASEGSLIRRNDFTKSCDVLMKCCGVMHVVVHSELMRRHSVKVGEVHVLGPVSSNPASVREPLQCFFLRWGAASTSRIFVKFCIGDFYKDVWRNSSCPNRTKVSGSVHEDRSVFLIAGSDMYT
jgi:hypothetical protein